MFQDPLRYKYYRFHIHSKPMVFGETKEFLSGPPDRHVY